jgi:hypothetical protein
MRPAAAFAILACALALLSIPAASYALEPPNQNDPCSHAGRNVCGTLGVGYYKRYRYGIRWFGDFRDAVPGVAHTFCIDLGFWYPSAKYRYEAQPASTLRSRNGRPVSAEDRAKMTYAAWTFGRTTDADQQAAVMLYVHSLMHDARPGEIAPVALGPAVAKLYDQIASATARRRGPYVVDADLPDGLVVGRQATVTVRVRSATGAPMPGIDLSLSAKGVAGVPATARTDGAGLARVVLTPATAAGPTLSVTTEPLPGSSPKVYSPAAGSAALNGQRLIAPTATRVSAVFAIPAVKARLGVATVAVPSQLMAGQESRDRVTVSGPLPSWQGVITVRIHGPFPSADAIRCDGPPAQTTTLGAVSRGVFTTPPMILDRAGWYTYEEVVPPDSRQLGVKTRCGLPQENVRVDTRPRITTIVGSDRVSPGSPLFDRVFVEGLAGQPATVHAELYGPFPERDAITCSGAPIWSGSFEVANEGEYQTPSFVVMTPGFYAYRETITAGEFVRSTTTSCADTAETTIVVARPKIATKVNGPVMRPGGTVADTVTVSGLGPLAAEVQATLWGPFPTRSAIHCSGTPFWSGSFDVRGTGTFSTPPVKLEKAGYYAFREALPEGPANEAFTAPCPDVAETVVARAAPTVSTRASNEVVRPGARIFDRIRVYGLGETPAAIDVQLFGPFPSRVAVGCTMKPFWHGRVYAKGSGPISSPGVKVTKAGFYAWRERIVGSPLVAVHTTACALAVEMSLVRPEIVTGRGDVARYAAAPGAGGLTPTRIRLASVGIDAPVFPSQIDIPNGVLGVPGSIANAGWWRDGSAPGAKTGAILIAGHVDSAQKGVGAFFHLHDAAAGERVEVVTAGGQTFTYRVVSVHNYPKSELPADVYSVRGPPRLVLVTCGGPFDRAARHYRDNIVVTAVPD